MKIDRAVYEALPPEEKAWVDEQLALLDEQFQRNPLEAFRPYPKQADFLGSRHRTKAFFGGNRAGKTEVGVVDDLIQCLDPELVPEHLKPFKRWSPPFHCRVVIPAFGQGDVVLLEKLRALCPPSALIGDSFDKALQKQPNMRLRFKNGSWILINTGDQDRQLHAGVKLHRVHFDEEPQGERGFGIYRENRARLLDYAPESQMVFTMTPQMGLTWTYDEVASVEDPDTFTVVASMFDNPYLPRLEVEKFSAELSDEEREMLVEGRFAAFHGRVMDVREHHKVEPPSKDHVRALDVTYVGIDPGWRRGGVLWGGFDVDNRLLIFDELYPERLTPEEIVPRIREKNAFWGIDPLYLIDPSARNSSLQSGESVESVYHSLGIYPIRASNDRLASVLQIRARLQADSLLISRDCRNLLFEVDRWLVAADEVSAEQKIKVKGAGGSFATIGPDHLGDLVRYLCLERLWYTRPRGRERNVRGWQPNQAPPSRDLVLPSAGPPMGSLS